MKKLIAKLSLVLAMAGMSSAFAAQVHIEQLGVGVALANILEQPNWALLKEEGATSAYTAWVDQKAALVVIEKDDNGRVLRFLVHVPGGGERAAGAYQALKEDWGKVHERTGSTKIINLSTCENLDKTLTKETMFIGGLYELSAVIAGPGSQGVNLMTKERPAMSPQLSEYLAQIDTGNLAGSDPEWSGAYLAQIESQASALKAAAACEVARPFKAPKEFALGRPVEEQSAFVEKNGKWAYSGFFVAYDLPFADGDATVDYSGRLQAVQFERNNISVGDFNTMVESAKTEMGSAATFEQTITEEGTTSLYRWKTAAGSVEMAQTVKDSQKSAGPLTMRYYLRDKK